ncbi:pilus assembly protein TadG-related protein [Pseudomonas sp. NPDC090201]|uniref:pilus assembly protein TadG-related protein n=1 Tax=Pseudomonas sp. NPDC090201 TaxID=3364475 RepID=UPI0038106FE4
MSPLMYPCARRERQRGAIGLMAALTMALALLCTLVVVDSGRLYMEKRTLQRVADMAALEAASLNGNCIGASSAKAYATQSATRNGFTVIDASRTLTTLCGTLAVGANSRRAFTLDASRSDAIQVTVSHSVPRSIAAGIGAMFGSATPADVALTAVAVAAKPSPPMAQLTIRSSLLSVNVDQSRANSLNSALSALLGSTVNLSLASWKGLLDTDVNLLKFADQLAIALNVKAGDYTQLLATNTTLTKLIGASISALQQSGATATITAAINGLTSLQTAVAGSGAGSSLVKLGDLLNVQSGTPSAGLDAGLQAFQLVQTLAQLANSKNAAAITQSISVPGLALISAKVKVIEPPQLSAVGNPLLAKADPMGANRIYVRTAQVRALVTVDLPLLTGVVGLVNTVAGLTGPLTSTVNGLLNLNLSAVGCLLGTKCTQTDPQVLPNGVKVSLGLELAAANAHVTDVNCTTDATKTLTTQTNTALATVRVGTIDETTFFSSLTPTNADPLAIVDIGTKACSNLLLIPLTCDPRKPFAAGGLGLTLNTSLVGNAAPYTYVFNQPPELTKPPAMQPAPPNDIVNSLSTTLSGISINQFGPNANATGLGALLNTVASTFSGVTSLVGALIKSTLSPLLDPLLNSLLSNLGIDVTNIDIGANLSCHPGQAQLVI